MAEIPHSMNENDSVLMRMSHLELPAVLDNAAQKRKSLPIKFDLKEVPIIDPKLQKFTKKVSSPKRDLNLSFLLNDKSMLSPNKNDLDMNNTSSFNDSTTDDDSEISPRRRKSSSTDQRPNRISSHLSRSNTESIEEEEELESSFMQNSGDRTFTRDVIEKIIIELVDTSIEDISVVEHSEEEIIEKFREHFDGMDKVHAAVRAGDLQIDDIWKAIDQLQQLSPIIVLNEEVAKINQQRNHFIQIMVDDLEKCNQVKNHPKMTSKIYEEVEKIEEIATDIYFHLIDQTNRVMDHLQETLDYFCSERKRYRSRTTKFCKTQSNPDPNPKIIHESNVDYNIDRFEYKIALAKFFNELGSSNPLLLIVPHMKSRFMQDDLDFVQQCQEEFLALSKIF